MTFSKGESGNPKGRPPGISDKRTRWRALLEPHAEALMGKAVELALAGDTTALRLCLEWLCPPIRSHDEPVAFPLPEQGTLTATGQAILTATAHGTLSPQQARQLLGALAGQARIAETDELIRRIEALEQPT